ncbi:MAG: hypothetical protein AB7T37_03935 [Dehalococcoidia bacterium]
MSSGPSELFDFLAAGSGGSIERYELHLPAFTDLRRSLGAIVSRLRETEDSDAIEASDAIRIHLSEWLTAPVPFDQRLFDWSAALGEPGLIETRWGSDIRKAHDVAIDAARELLQAANPARVGLRDVLLRLSKEGRPWRIFCHRRVRGHFESLGHEIEFSSETFLHSVADYRDTSPFEVLLKCGPLRSRGWGSAPDALLTAPRFRTLTQFVWAGSVDEDGFGLDPVAGASSGSPETLTGTSSTARWTRRTIAVGDTSARVSGPEPALDELTYFQQISRDTSLLRSAVLIDVGDDCGVLLPPNAKEPSFNPQEEGDESPFDFRVPGETLAVGMFLIRGQLGDLDFGGVQATDGHYSRVWKQKLAGALSSNTPDLIRRLRDAGLNLQHLAGDARRWRKPPTNVIHAPQQKKHFEILVRVLGIDHEPGTPASVRRRPWWQYAWHEIARSRGEAIMEGTQKQEIKYEELFTLLGDVLPELKAEAPTGTRFRYAIPPGRSLSGVVHFYPVRFIEAGFRVPEYALRELIELDTVEQWRD